MDIVSVYLLMAHTTVNRKGSTIEYMNYRSADDQLNTESTEYKYL